MAEILRAEQLGKTYGEGEAATHALADVTFGVEPGEFAAIVGQSGSGKSTLLNLLGLLDSPTKGSVSFEGSPVSELNKAQRSRVRGERIGFVFQFHYLLPEFSVFENVSMPAQIAGVLSAEAIRSRVTETLGMLDLDGLEPKNANQLSGGQKQRVAIARALMNRPALVLADEPTGNLDTVNTDLVYDLFRKVNAETGTAFMIVTHDRSVAQRTDRILEISDGRLVQDVRNTYAR